MVGRRVALLPQVTVASPAYLARMASRPSSTALSSHRAVNYVSSATGKRGAAGIHASTGRETAMVLPSAVSVTGAELYTGSALAGLGIVQVPRYRVASELARGRLKIMLAGLSAAADAGVGAVSAEPSVVVARAGVRAVAAGYFRSGGGAGGGVV